MGLRVREPLQRGGVVRAPPAPQDRPAVRAHLDRDRARRRLQAQGGRRMPIRAGLTLAFTVVMAVVLAATGAFLYDRMQSDLDATINQGLRSRADDIAALVRQADTGLADSQGSRLSSPQTSFAQVLDSKGGVMDASAGLRGRPLI